jgi:hypothetical protein
VPGDYIARLMQWDPGVGISAENYARLRADPRYARAVRTFASNVLAAGDADRLLDGVLKDAGRNVAALSAVYLHFTGGLTLPRLKALCASFGFISAGRARALLLYLRYLGYVERSTTHKKGAPALYVPTARFLDTWRDYQRTILNAVQILEPAVGLLIDRFDEPGVFETFSRKLCEVFLDAAHQADVDAPYFRVVLHRNAGIQIVHALLAAEPDDVFPPVRPIPFSLSATARRFRVSRVHVRRLADDAAREGLLRFADEGTIALEPAGRMAIDHVFATQMIRFLMVAARTMKAGQDLAERAVPAPAHPPAARLDHVPALFG